MDTIIEGVLATTELADSVKRAVFLKLLGNINAQTSEEETKKLLQLAQRLYLNNLSNLHRFFGIRLLLLF
jgi:hypothetical protein